MGPEAHQPGDGERRRQMLAAIESAVLDEDTEFFDEIVSDQTLLGPVDLSEYMNVKRKNAEDPVEQRRWHDALNRYIDGLRGKEFSKEDAEVLNGIIRDMKFEDITEGEEVTEEAETDTGTAEADYGWDNATFRLRVDQKTLDRVRRTLVFQRAEAIATGRSGSYANPNAVAKKLIKDNVSGDMRTTMLSVLDWYVFQRAEKIATNRVGSYADPLNPAAQECKNNSSGHIAEADMRDALDKHVYARAKGILEGKIGSYAEPWVPARKVVETYASTPARKKAMLEQLGFL